MLGLEGGGDLAVEVVEAGGGGKGVGEEIAPLDIVKASVRPPNLLLVSACHARRKSSYHRSGARCTPKIKSITPYNTKAVRFFAALPKE